MNFKRRTGRVIAMALCLVLTLSLLGTVPVSGSARAEDGQLLVGTGIGDITGPITEISTGYNSIGDLMQGVLMKLYARAFIAATDDARVCYVSAEIVHMTESIKPGVIKELQSRGLGDYYNEQNVMLAATHCHSSPSNTSWYALYDLVNGTPGFDDLHYKIVVQGIADAIENAHSSLRPGTISINSGNLEGAANNRSLLAYNQNIDAADFSQSLNTEMTLLRFDGEDGAALGALNWFGSHGTSNSIDNVLVSADHKGYAAYQFEQRMGDGFVAAFAQNESGDASPNQPQEDITADFKRPADLDASLDVIENEIVHGEKELNKAVELYSSASETLSASVDYRHSYVDFSDLAVDPAYIGEYAMPYDDINNARTGTPCIGAGIMAGDEEGAPVDSAAEGQVRNTYEIVDGEVVRHKFSFASEDLNGLQYLLGPLWPVAEAVLGTDKYENEQMEKVVCLPVGDLMQTIQPLQVFTIGELAIVGIPFECTAMQARRTRAVLEETLAQAGITKVVFSTLTNSYSQYVTTREEYAAQHYEGSTVLFGAWSGAALTQELDTLCKNLVSGEASNPGPSPRDLSNSAVLKTSAARTGVVRDAGEFGKVKTDVSQSYSAGETVTAVFQGAAPRNVPELKSKGQLSKFFDPETYSYMEVQQKQDDGSWLKVRTEADPYTTFSWARDGANLSPKSLVTLTWLLRDAEAGTYRFAYNCVSRNLFGTYKGTTGYSSEFTVQ